MHSSKGSKMELPITVCLCCYDNDGEIFLLSEKKKKRRNHRIYCALLKAVPPDNKTRS